MLTTRGIKVNIHRTNKLNNFIKPYTNEENYTFFVDLRSASTLSEILSIDSRDQEELVNKLFNDMNMRN
ncbi:MAG: hypothetical protein ABIH00_04505 [Armatimonadota bacterium]